MAELRRLETVALDEIVGVADLGDRYEVKFLVPYHSVTGLIDALNRRHGRARVLEIDGQRDHRCVSYYFDTPGLQLYRAQAQGRRRRFKVRTRSYFSTASTMFELKLRDGSGRTRKHRVPHAESNATVLGPAAELQLAEQLAVHYGTTPPRGLVHTATVTYQRATLLIEDKVPERVTIDRQLVLTAGNRPVELSERWALVETKSARFAGSAARTLHALGHHPISISKYALALTAAHPEVRGNSWLRPLRRLTS
jgi:hypothetical protein